MHPPHARHPARPPASRTRVQRTGGAVRSSALLLALALLAGCAGSGAGRAVPERFASCHPAHCVSSRASGEAQVAPITHALDADAAAAQLRCVAGNLPRSRILVDEPDYLQLTVQSRWMRYVDEVEFALQPGRIDVRSASRFGYYDFGVNRARVEAVRQAFAAPCTRGAIPAAGPE